MFAFNGRSRIPPLRNISSARRRPKTPAAPSTQTPGPPSSYQYFKNRTGGGGGGGRGGGEGNPWSSFRVHFNQNPLFYGTLTIGFGFCGFYYVSHLERVPISGRRRFIDLSPRSEQMLATQALNHTLNEFGHKILPANHPYSSFVKKVAQRLINVLNAANRIGPAAAGALVGSSSSAEMTTAAAAEWEVFVVADPTRNAFVLPGGKIFVFTGILPVVGDEDGLAAVISHEVGRRGGRGLMILNPL